MKQLHILNGDASRPAFEAAGLAGEVVVWREILADGPADYTLPETAFWKEREHYITSTFSETPEGYNQKVLAELKKLEHLGKDDEVILWFDADLICQVNLLYLLTKLQQLELKLIAVCSVEASETIGLLQPDRVQQAYQERQTLRQAQLQQAQELWKLYAGPNPLLLQQYLTEHTILLPYLKEALRLHLTRFPDCQTGLGHPQHVLLQLVQNGATTLMDLMQAFWKQEAGYGFGDWQLQIILGQLRPQFLSVQEPLQLTEYGRQVLQQTKHATLIPEKEQWLGGVKPGYTGGYCYNRQTGLLEAKTGKTGLQESWPVKEK